MDGQIPLDGIDSAVTRLVGGGDLATAKVGLFTNSIGPSAPRVIGDLTEPTFTGYAQKNASLAALPNLTPGDLGWESVGALCQWKPTAGTGLPQTVNGFFLTDTGGTKLLAMGVLDSPFTFNSTGDQLSGVVTWQWVYGNVPVLKFTQIP